VSIYPPVTGAEAADRLAIRELVDAYAALTQHEVVGAAAGPAWRGLAWPGAAWRGLTWPGAAACFVTYTPMINSRHSRYGKPGVIGED
jgi:hypothetical protein